MVVGAAVLLRVTTSGAAGYAVLGGYALLGRAQVIEALALCWLFNLLNREIVPELADATARYVVIAAACASIWIRPILSRRFEPAGAPVIGAALLGAFLVVHAVLFSQVVDVSVLKASVWAVTMTTVAAAWSQLPPPSRAAVVTHLFLGLGALLLASLPLLFSPAGYLRNDRGFQGVLDHPQVFGMAMALLGAWAASRILAGQRPLAGVAATLASGAMVVLSGARGAGLALLVGVGGALLAAPILSGRSVPASLPGPSRRMVRAASVVLLVGGVHPLRPVRRDRRVSLEGRGTRRSDRDLRGVARRVGRDDVGQRPGGPLAGDRLRHRVGAGLHVGRAERRLRPAGQRRRREGPAAAGDPGGSRDARFAGRRRLGLDARPAQRRARHPAARRSA